jgi:hypothetical protein
MVRSLLPVREAGSAAASIQSTPPVNGSVRVTARQLPARYVPLSSAALPAVRRCNHHADEADGTRRGTVALCHPGQRRSMIPDALPVRW